MRLSAEIRDWAFGNIASDRLRNCLKDWVGRAEKMEHALQKIGSKAVDEIDHDLPLRMADALSEIEELAKDALSE